jgi:Ion channel
MMSDPTERPDETSGLQVQGRRSHRLLHAFVSAESYGLVLLLIVVTYVLSVSMRVRWSGSIVLLVQIATVWLALRTARARPSVRRVADVLFVVVAVVAVVNLFPGQQTRLLGLVFAVNALLYLIAPVLVLRDVAFRRSDVGEQTVLGAIAAYLLLGMFFAFTYRTIAQFQPGPFFGAQGEGNLSDDLFFSFITLTTTGYGNLVPARNPGQSLAVFEAVLGQLFLVTAVAKIISSWKPKPRRAISDSDD